MRTTNDVAMKSLDIIGVSYLLDIKSSMFLYVLSKFLGIQGYSRVFRGIIGYSGIFLGKCMDKYKETTRMTIYKTL
jgi:hypothetical protein